MACRSKGAGFNFYGPQYSRFNSPLHAATRREVHVGWGYGSGGLAHRGGAGRVRRISSSQRGRLGPRCGVGAGGPSLKLVECLGCRLIGLDIEAAGVRHATAQANSRGLSHRATFQVANCDDGLPFDDEKFEAVFCMDAISHFRDRLETLSQFARLLRRGGRLIYTDNFVLTGLVLIHELGRRATIGSHLIVPPGFNEQSIEAVGLNLISCDNRTSTVAGITQRWHAARARRAETCSGRKARNRSSSDRISLPSPLIWPPVDASHAFSTSQRNQLEKYPTSGTQKPGGVETSSETPPVAGPVACDGSVDWVPRNYSSSPGR